MDWNDLIFHPGNEELQRFIELGIMAASLEIPFHFHVEGMRGTGKTTLIRAARTRLPLIDRVSGCLYNCRPDEPHCPQHSSMQQLAAEQVAMPFLEISHSAKIGTVAGSIDLGRLTSPDSPAAAVLPGTLPRANRGIVFVDEVNRLADTSPALVDVLLDAMGTKPGRVQIEETGLPTVEIPLYAGIWAASNPDEEPGPLQEIRRQLADRFDFVVKIDRPANSGVVRSIINAGRKGHPPGSGADFAACKNIFAQAEFEERAEEFLGEVYIRFQLESIRSVQAAKMGALLHAAAQGRYRANFGDLAVVLPAALRHRLEPQVLLEVAQALQNAAEDEKRKSESRQTVKMPKQVHKGAQPRYPAFWRGLWQRLGQSGKSGGREVQIKDPQPNIALSTESKTDEKKKMAAAVIQAGKGSQEE